MSTSSNGAVVWRPLPVKSHDIPSLLVSVVLGAADYSVRVTDLLNVWQENLGRREILMQCFRENTSIDPSEDKEQMRIFMDKIESALTPWHPDHHLTTTTLSRPPVEDDDDKAKGKDGRKQRNTKNEAGKEDEKDKDNGDLLLNITCRLPAGIRPLKWQIHLKKMTPSSTATEVVLPLIEAQFTRQREIQSLVDIVTQKDTIISKLLDKLEGVGIELDQIFNHLPTKKKLTRAMAAERIRGLAPYEPRGWKVEMDSGEGKPENVPGLLKAVFDSKGLRYKPTLDICDSPELEDWWTNMSKSAKLPIRDEIDVPPEEAPSPPKTAVADDEDFDNDDNFQVQATPPHLASSNRRRAAEPQPATKDASTTGAPEIEVPDSVPPEASPSQQAKKQTSRMPSKLGSLGKGKRPAPKPPSPVPEPKDDDDDETETASEDEEVPQPVVVKEEPKLRSKGGLGRIGGGKAKAAATLSVSPPPKTAQSPKETSGPSPRKLGVIGKKVDTSARDGERGRTASVKAEEQKEARLRETSEERANRKREELRLELERKEAAGPAKKKRRF